VLEEVEEVLLEVGSLQGVIVRIAGPSSSHVQGLINALSVACAGWISLA
jgi:hypothetical protein